MNARTIIIVAILLFVETDIGSSSEHSQGKDRAGDDKSHEDSEEGSSRSKCRCVYAWMAKTSDVMSPGELVGGRVYTRPRKKDHFWGQPRRYAVLERFIDDPRTEEPHDGHAGAGGRALENDDDHGDASEEETQQEPPESESKVDKKTKPMGRSMGFFAPASSSVEKGDESTSKPTPIKKKPHRSMHKRKKKHERKRTQGSAAKHNSTGPKKNTGNDKGEESLPNKKIEKRSNTKSPTKQKSLKMTTAAASSTGSQNNDSLTNFSHISLITSTENVLKENFLTTTTTADSPLNSTSEPPANKDEIKNSTVVAVTNNGKTSQGPLAGAMVMAHSESKFDVNDEGPYNLPTVRRRRRRKRSILIKMVCP